MRQRQYPDRWALAAELRDCPQQVFHGARTSISLRAFAADPTRLSFLADIRAHHLGEDEPITFAFDETARHDPNACTIRAGDPATALDHAHVQRGGGGSDDGLGRWTFTLRVVLAPDSPPTPVRVLAAWPQTDLAEHIFDIDPTAIAEATARSRYISHHTT